MAAVRRDEEFRSGDPAGQQSGAVGRAIVIVLGRGDEGWSADVAQVDLGWRGGVLRVEEQTVGTGFAASMRSWSVANTVVTMPVGASRMPAQNRKSDRRAVVTAQVRMGDHGSGAACSGG